ncbi:unnamed protein product [Strongylus vulgaris]|uniref:Uncharacterized protein n=1 Tax=Strongylus vulgaris TaxID=40348 RepID=A0A3P7K3J8_STRVU|nr:unnamed protein product [Strongylus vulgaris]
MCRLWTDTCQDLPARRRQTSDSCPEILLRCDQLWDFLEAVSPQYTLPSALLLIPSKPPARDSNGPVLTNFEAEFEEDRDRWDKYWTMDSAGVCEFTGTKDAEHEATSTKVVQFFNDTIPRRDDGYYSKSDLLQTYDKAIKDQFEKEIIQETPGDRAAVGKHSHYMPHQPMITPHKDCPSLNDVLYQGPLILSELYAMLLRFRMAPFAAVSDVEKAFL